MAHDLLELAEECEKEAAFLVIVCGASPTKTLDARAAAALRAAHEEFEYFNSFRDELQTANTKLTLENRELRELVKRHENALEWMFAQDDWFVSRKPLLSNKGTTLTGQETEFDTIGPLRKYSYSFHLEEVEFTADTPLAAIEAAMKEEQA